MAYEVLGGKRVDLHHGVAIVVLFLLLLGGYTVFHLYAVTFGYVFECFRIAQPLVLHDERDGIARLAAPETLEYAFGRRHHERRRLLVMKRTTRHVVDALFLERNEIAYYLHDVYRGVDSVYGSLVYHGMQR